MANNNEMTKNGGSKSRAITVCEMYFPLHRKDRQQNHGKFILHDCKCSPPKCYQFQDVARYHCESKRWRTGIIMSLSSQYNFEGRFDFVKFVKTLQEAGLFVHLHIGPYACAEWNYGLIEIKELDEFAQAAFQGYKSLNFIQSRIFQTTYYTNEKNLVCAPTGARKTNIAMIFVLHEFGQHFKDGYLHKNEHWLLKLPKHLPREEQEYRWNRTEPRRHRHRRRNRAEKRDCGPESEEELGTYITLAFKQNKTQTRDYASPGNKVELRAFYIGTIKATYGTNGVTAGAEIPIGLKDSKVPLGCEFNLDKHSYHRLKNLSSDIAKNQLLPGTGTGTGTGTGYSTYGPVRFFIFIHFRFRFSTGSVRFRPIVNLMKENLFASQGGPIILAQVEIEYGNVEGAYGVGGELYVKWAAETAISEFEMVVPAQLTAEAVNELIEGNDLLLGRWSALQMAIQNEWGGRDTRQKAQQLALDIYHWLIRLAVTLYVDDLENLLDDFMLSLNTEIDNGSIEEIKSKLLLHLGISTYKDLKIAESIQTVPEAKI
ncbi:hypothetical protein LXL04_009927 [Taraxacum kok-saghyz]